MPNTLTPLPELLGQAHAALLQDLAALAEATGPEALYETARLSTHLDRVRTHLGDHFRFEEQNGYMDGLLKQRPHLERSVQRLLEEHGQLLRSLDELIATARLRNRLQELLGRQVREWVEQVRRHEVRENGLVEDAYNLDLGTDD